MNNLFLQTCFRLSTNPERQYPMGLCLKSHLRRRMSHGDIAHFATRRERVKLILPMETPVAIGYSQKLSEINNQ